MKFSNMAAMTGKLVLWSLVFLWPVGTAVAYETPTHMSITQHALLRSDLNDPGTLYRLGLFPELIFTNVGRPSGDIYPENPDSSIRADAVVWLAAHKEDDGRRSLQHFFDPHNNRGLQVHRVASDDYTNVGLRSHQWALGSQWTEVPEGAVAPPPQEWSLTNARNRLFDAITSTHEHERKEAYGEFLAALGHTLHHIQDMAQPDHVRNDSHCDDELNCFVIGDLISSDKIYDPSDYERQIREEGYEAYNQTDYPIIALANYQDFWTNSTGTGLADFTNRFAVSPDTNYRGYIYLENLYNFATHPEFPSPGITGIQFDEKTEIVNLLDAATVETSVLVLRAPFQDHAIGGGVEYTHETATESLYAWSISAATGAGIELDVDLSFTLDEDNYHSAATHLLPRAEAYSASFINYMLRGRMGVRISERGYYAAADQADNEGFRRIRVQLRNETPAVTPPVGSTMPQNIGAGEIVAVASYRSNPCYRPDLRGDLHIADDGTGYFPENCNWAEWGSGEQIHVVSAPVSVTGLSNEWTEMLFDFSEETIPFSALDLELFFVFRGQLGAESDDLVVARHDISEPTYMGMLNSTDLWWYLTSWVDGYSLLDNDQAWDDDRVAQLIDTKYSLEGFEVAYAPLTPSKHQRLAVLVDADDYANFRLDYEFAYWQDGYAGALLYSVNPTLNQMRPVKRLKSSYHDVFLYSYEEDWCDAVGCTLSGLEQERGISRWGNIDLWFYDGPRPTDEQVQSREPADTAASEGIIVID